jgi:hypothetical protein
MHAETSRAAVIRADLPPRARPRRMRILLRVGGLATPIGQRAASIAHLLLAVAEGLTRVEMLRVGTPGLALGAPGYICRLRKAGAPIESVPVIGLDAAGEPVRFVRYVLRGEIQITREPWPQEEGTR